MLVEHAFVTTLEAPEALAQAAALLASLGFRITSSGPDSLEAARGLAYPRSRKVVRLPQNVHLQYDRGRVTLAAAITPRQRKDLAIHAELMTALVRGLERLLADRQPPAQAAAEWLDVEARAGSVWLISEKIALGCLCALFLAMIVAMILAVVRR